MGPSLQMSYPLPRNGSKFKDRQGAQSGFEDTASLPHCPLDATGSEEFCFSGRSGEVPPPVSPALPSALLRQGIARLILLYQSPGQWGGRPAGVGYGLPQLIQTTVSKSSDISSQRSSPSRLH